MNISDQRIRGEKNEKKERIGKVIAVHTVRKSREAGLCGDRRSGERGADVPFLIPPVGGFVPRPSRKWELGRQQLTKEL